MHSVLIDRPAEEVWAFVTDLHNSPNWTRSGSELRQTSPGALQVGATVESVRRIAGREIKSQYVVVTEYEPNRLLSVETMVPLLGRFSQRLVFESVADGTQLTRSGEGEFRGVLRPLRSVAPRLIGSVWMAELTNLKRLIEARA